MLGPASPMLRSFPRTLLVLSATLIVAVVVLHAAVPPDITPIPNQTVGEDAAAFDVTVTVTPDAVENDPIATVTVESIVPAGVVTATITNAEPWVITVTPVANASGTATITVRATDTQADTQTATFDVTVTPVADTPSVTNATTAEDTQTTSGLVITRNAADGAEVTHFKITAIAGGTLFQNDGTTPIADGAFITEAEGNAGLRFTPAANSTTAGSFGVQASLAANDTGLGGAVATATITVTPVADTPSVTNATTAEDTQTTSGLVITRNAADGAEVTHFKITAVAGGTLFQNDGTTPIADGAFITEAQGNAGLRFTPAANSTTAGGFGVQASLAANDTGLGGAVATATITVTPVADTPSVTNATTAEDTQTTSGLVITRNAADQAEVTHFKITAIAGGTLFQNDGTTPIADGAFVTAAQGSAGLRFTPAANSTTAGSFGVQASTAANDAGLGGAVVTATITVTPVADTPSVTNATTAEDTQTTSGLVITRNAADQAEVTHFKITVIAGGTLFQNDGTTPIADGAFITTAQGSAGLRFTPAANSATGGSFGVQASLAANDAGLGGAVVTATITVTPVADTPSVTNATTAEDTQTTSGLVITRNAADGAEVTHFKITAITGGTLFQSDGTTPIASGAFITAAQGSTGLRFTPAANSTAAGSFGVQASTSASDAGLGGAVVTATITVTPVADTPSVTNATTAEDTQTTSGLVITRNAADQTEVTHFKITAITGGTLFLANGTTAVAAGTFITAAQGSAGLRFTPAANSITAGSFGVQASLAANDTGLGGAVVTATITVTPVADTPSVTNATTAEDTQTTSGLVITRNAADGPEVTHFKITAITGGSLFLANGTTAVAAGAFITAAQGSAGLRFTPAANSTTAGSFGVQASTSASDAGLGGAVVTATITVTPVADTPSVTNATTAEDTQTTSGLVITRNAADGPEVTHFKITAITGGSLFLANGTTAVTAGAFITAAQGSAGLRFTPAANSTTAGSFGVQASLAANDGGLGGGIAVATITITPVDDPPTVDPIADQQTPEDVEKAVSVAIADVDTAVGALSVSATSSNQAVVAPAGIVVDAGTGAVRTLRLTPVANASGTTDITVTAFDGQVASAPRQFRLTVTPVNDAPTVTNLGDVSTPQGIAVGPIGFTVGDVETPATALLVSVSVSDATLVSVALGGSGAARTLTLTPAAGRTGTTTVTVTVSDGTAATPDSFVLTVNPANAPVIGGLGPVEIAEDTATGQLPFTVTDVDGIIGPVTAVSSNPALVPNTSSAIAIAGGPGVGNRTITLTPAANQFGETTITVAAADHTGDPALTGVASFTLRVTAVNDPPTISAIAPLLMVRNTPATVSFAVEDIDTPQTGLVRTAVSSNAAVVNNTATSLEFEGSGASTSLKIRAQDNATGQTTVTVTVSDGQATASRAFVVTVQDVACTFTFTPTRVAVDAAGGTRSVTVTTPLGCAWRVRPESPAPWLSGATVGPAFNTGAFLLSVAANAAATPRETRLLLAEVDGSGVVLRPGAATLIVAQDSATAGDADADGLPSAWERQFGLDAASSASGDGALGDPDGDGVSNLDELRRGTHPRGLAQHTRFLAEGATGEFFQTRLAVLNPGDAPAHVLLRFQRRDGTVASHPVEVPALTRATIDVGTAVAGMADAEFSTVLESDEGVVLDRTMTWDRGGYGSHAETALVSPATTWYLAEGATHSGFDLFYLLQNPADVPARARVQFLRPDGAPLEKVYVLEPRSRTNIWVDNEVFDGLGTALSNTDVSAVLTSLDATPIIVERAMYLSTQGRLFNAGHESAGVTAPATRWLLAEGATGPFFDLFVLLANPGAQPADVRVTYLLPSGVTYTRTLRVPPVSRRNIWVDTDTPDGTTGQPLADVAVSTTVEVTNGVPIIVERAMWWPGPTPSSWAEAHNSAGATATGTVWALAEGEQGPQTDTYVLIANTSAAPGSARVRLVFEDGTTAERTFPLLGLSRFNVEVAREFPEASGRRFGVIVESLGATPAALVVERAMYSSPGGAFWAAGSNALATKLR